MHNPVLLTFKPRSNGVLRSEAFYGAMIHVEQTQILASCPFGCYHDRLALRTAVVPVIGTDQIASGLFRFIHLSSELYTMTQSMDMKTQRLWFIVLMAINGCVVYHPKPLVTQAESIEQNSPDMKEIRLQAETFTHPHLPAVTFDDRDGLSPDEAAILAVLANPALRAIRGQRDIAEAQLLQAGLLPNPRLAYELGTPVGGDTQGRVNRFDLGLDWDITSLLTRSSRVGEAQAHTKAVDLEVGWQEWQVAQAARLRAYRLLLGETRLSLAQEAQAATHRQWQDMKRAITLGIKTQLDLTAVEDAWQSSTARTLEAQATLDQENLMFNRVLGVPSQQVIHLKKMGTPQIESCTTAQALFEEAMTRRLDLLALQYGYKSQESRVRAAVRAQFPKISLGLTGGRDTDDVETLGVGLSIELPFFDTHQGQIATEQATRQQLFDAYTARLFETRSDLDQLIAALAATRQQMTVMDERLISLATRAQNRHRAAQAGEIDVFAYHQANIALSNQRIQKIDLEQKLIDLGVALEIASGHYGLVSETKPVAREHSPVPSAKEAL